MKKSELKTELDKLEVKYDDAATNKELEALLKANVAAEPEMGVISPRDAVVAKASDDYTAKKLEKGLAENESEVVINGKVYIKVSRPDGTTHLADKALDRARAKRDLLAKSAKYRKV
jgi:hypothetical protein